MQNDMSQAITKMVGVMKRDYHRFWLNSTTVAEKGTLSPFAQDQLDGFHDSIEISEGKKYIKIIRNDNQSMVWGFIVNTDTDAKFKRGDILKAAGWAAPARNKPRGNVFEDLTWVRWTGPEYL
jgi:hypothetical protein